jgi:chorismate mutase/prephenate dehydratase
MFGDSDLKIVSQIFLPVQHCLLSKFRRTQIKKVYAHSPSLGQCKGWLEAHLQRAAVIEVSSNTRAVELASREKASAAIGSSLAAEKYRLPILDRGLQDDPVNATVFLVLGHQCSPPTGHDSTSIMFSLGNRAGALDAALAPFRRYGINLTQIQSTPSQVKPGKYFCFVNCDGHVRQRKLARAIALLSKHCRDVKVLGSYPVAE